MHACTGTSRLHRDETVVHLGGRIRVHGTCTGHWGAIESLGRVPGTSSRDTRSPVSNSGPRASGDVSDEALLVRTGQGDRDAFATLYDRFDRRVYGLVRKIVRDPTLARDTTQEVMTELWRTAPRFDPGRGNAVSWVLTLAHRRAVDTVRREQSARDRVDAVGRREAAGRPFDDVSETVTMADEHREVRRALDALTELQRQAIEMAYFQAMTYREVARRLDVPLGTIKTRIRDGMIRLRDTMGVAP